MFSSLVKKVSQLSFVFLSLLAIFATFPFSALAAQNNIKLPSVRVDSINISGLTSSTLTGSFVLASSELSSVGSLYASIKLFENETDATAHSAFLVDEHFLPGAISLLPQESKTISFTYQYPQLLHSGVHPLVIQLYSDTGLPISVRSANVTLKGSGALLETRSKDLQIIDALGKPQTSLAGPSFDPGVSPQVVLPIYNPSDASVVVTPQIDIYPRFYLPGIEVVTQKAGDSFTIASKEYKKVTIALPSQVTPESYFASIHLTNAQNEDVSGLLQYRWVVKGEGAKIISVTSSAMTPGWFKQSGYLQVAVVGSADGGDVKGSTLRVTITPEGNTSASKPIVITNSNPTIGSAGQNLTVPFSVPTSFMQSVSSLAITTEILSSTGTVLHTNTTTLPFTPQATLSNQVVTVLILLGVFLALLIASVILRKRKLSNLVKVGIAVALLFIGSVPTHTFAQWYDEVDCANVQDVGSSGACQTSWDSSPPAAEFIWAPNPGSYLPSGYTIDISSKAIYYCSNTDIVIDTVDVTSISSVSDNIEKLSDTEWQVTVFPINDGGTIGLNATGHSTSTCVQCDDFESAGSYYVVSDPIRVSVEDHPYCTPPTLPECAGGGGAANQVIANQVVANQAVANQAVANQAVANQVAANQVAANQAVANQVVANQAIANQAIANQAIANQAIANQAISSNQVVVNQPAVNQPAVNQPAVNQPAVNQPAVNQPAVNQPAVNQPAVNQPAVNQPAVNQPAVNQPAVNQPAVNQPAVNQPAVNQPAVNQPAVNQPAVNQPAVNQPAVNQPAVNQPAVNQPAVNQPAVNQPAVNQPAVNQPAVNQPAVNQATSSSQSVPPDSFGAPGIGDDFNYGGSSN